MIPQCWSRGREVARDWRMSIVCWSWRSDCRVNGRWMWNDDDRAMTGWTDSTMVERSATAKSLASWHVSRQRRERGYEDVVGERESRGRESRWRRRARRRVLSAGADIKSTGTAHAANGLSTIKCHRCPRYPTLNLNCTRANLSPRSLLLPGFFSSSSTRISLFHSRPARASHYRCAKP